MRPSTLRRSVGVALVAACAAASGGEILFPTRAKTLCRLPCYDYCPRDATPPVGVETFDAVLVETSEITEVVPTPGGPATETRRLRVKVFQLSASEVRVDHCSLSNVAVTVREDGYWTLSFNAIQNPMVQDGRVATPQTRYLRNKFLVTARGFAASPLPSTEALGRPELVRCGWTGWVERSDAVPVFTSGRFAPHQLPSFGALDRFVVDLRYV